MVFFKLQNSTPTITGALGRRMLPPFRSRFAQPAANTGKTRSSWGLSSPNCLRVMIYSIHQYTECIYIKQFWTHTHKHRANCDLQICESTQTSRCWGVILPFPPLLHNRQDGKDCKVQLWELALCGLWHCCKAQTDLFCFVEVYDKIVLEIVIVHWCHSVFAPRRSSVSSCKRH